MYSTDVDNEIVVVVIIREKKDIEKKKKNNYNWENDDAVEKIEKSFVSFFSLFFFPYVSWSCVSGTLDFNYYETK